MIQRDGSRISLWQNEIPVYKPKNDPDVHAIYDVAIIGGGITGVSAAYLLRAAGKKCILIEANNLCFGTTGGTTAHLNTLLDVCLLYTSPSPRDRQKSRMPSSA